MFCSNCGKTVARDDKVCPHCQMALGDVRFEGMPYTSVQFRIVPGTPMPIDEAYSYTRTNYSVNIEDGQDPEPVVEDAEGEDVESATTYRPVLRSEEEELPAEEYAEAEGEEEEAAPQAEEDFDPDDLTEEQIASALKNLQEKGLDTDSLMVAEDYQEEEISEADRDERIQQYESEMRAGQERRQQKAARGKLKIPFLGKKAAYDGVDDADEAYDMPPEYETEQAYPDEAADEEAPAYEDAPADEAVEVPAEGEADQEVPAAEAYDEYGDEYSYEDEQYEDAPAGSIMDWLNASVAGIRVATILKAVGVIVVLVICLSLGLKWFGYVSDQQKKSPIDGVTLSLYNAGIEAITANATTEKTAELLSTYQSSGVVAFTAQQQQNTDALKALMPEEPSVNDQLFVDALTTIQDNIANAIIMDAMSNGANAVESQANWETINDSISALKSATDSVQLQAIVNEKVEVVTSTPEPTATPVSYKTLARGDEGQEVMELQQRLFELGYLADAADGKYGNKTTTAIKYFQMGHELTVSGIADSATQTLLFSDEAMNQEDAAAAYQARQAQEAGN